MKTIIVFLVILGSTFLSAVEKNGNDGVIRIQVAGQVNAPKAMEVRPNMTAAEFYKAAGANEFSTGRRLLVLRYNYIYEQSGIETTVRNLEFLPDERIQNLHLMNGDIVCIVMKPPVGG